jgi:deazaflavin-dependent oxidoreductase (nitroreductase family)
MIQIRIKMSGYHMLRIVTLRLLSVYQWLFEVTDGRLTWFLGKPVLLLRTTGARTGIERTAALVYATDGKNFVIVASAGGSDKHPAWYHNLLKHPDVGVQIGRERLRMKARVARTDERPRLWRLANENNSNRYESYQTKTTRQIPVVVLTPL